jgi:hypothetical protein
VSEAEEGGGGQKLGIVALIVGALGGMAKFADDCGRAAKVGGSATQFGDDALRGAGRVGGIGDDVGRTGVNLSDDALHAGKVPIALEAGSPVRLGEGALAKVADDAAPGAGKSVEEALTETGVNLSLEVVDWELADEGPDLDQRAGAPVQPVVIVTTDNPAHHRAFLQAALPGALIVIAGKADGDGAIVFGTERIADGEIHRRCAEREARCAVLTCAADAEQACLALAAGIGRSSAARVSRAGAPGARYAELVYGLLDQRAKSRAGDVGISRVDVRGDKIVRTKLGSAERRQTR